MGQRAFTLVEVVLAILIIVGIMSVLLYFYQRAAETRELVMKETEFISVGRLFFEKISTELRGARVDPEEFAGMEGSSNSITFVSLFLKLSRSLVYIARRSVSLVFSACNAAIVELLFPFVLA